MLENPQNSPSEHDQASPLAKMSNSARREFWTNLVTPKCQAPLEATLKPIVEILDHSFGTPSPWADQAERAAMLSLFLRSITRETCHEIHAKRDEEPAARMFLERMDRELRDAIPLLSTSGKGGLFRSGYPLGTGEGSLTELCISEEISRRGPQGLIELFALCLQSSSPIYPWTETLIIAANAALRDVPPQVTDRYVAGLALLSNHSRQLAPRINDLFDGMATNTPFEVLLTAYNKANIKSNVALEIKSALLAETLDALKLSTGNLFEDEVSTLRNAGALPDITLLAIPLVQRIRNAIQGGESASTRDVESLKKLLVKRSGKPFREAENAPDSSPTSNTSTVQAESLLADAPDTGSPATSPELPKKTHRILNQLKTLSHEQLRPYLLLLLENGLERSTSTLSWEFTRYLNEASLMKLVAMRHVIESSDRSPEPLVLALQKRVQEELTYAVPTLNALNLAYLYQMCLLCEAPALEVKIVRNALRDALGLPERDDMVGGTELSDAGTRVWKWIFQKLPPEPELLSDLCRAHLPKMLAHLARNISNELHEDSTLTAFLTYANELGLLESFRPGRSLHGVELWKVVCFTAHLRQEIGDTHGLFSAVVESLRDRLLTKPPEWKDSFSVKWLDSFKDTSVGSLCSDIQASILSMPRALRTEEIACLLHNAHILARRGPTQFASLRDYARAIFISRVERIDPNRFRAVDNHILKEIIEGLAAARYRSLSILNILAEECVRRAESFSPNEFADIAVAFGDLRAGDSIFWSTFASHVETNWDSYRSDFLLFSLWSLVVMAPEKVPSRFNASLLRNHPSTRVLHKVTQSLIALGRYTPHPNDEAYQYLITSLGPFKQHAHEKDFMRELPRHIGMPAHTIFPQVVVGGFETDLMVDFGHRRLIIELDGISHFLEGPDGGILQGKDEFQDKVFTRLGYKVFHFPLTFKDRDQGYRSLNTLVNTLK